MEILKELRLKSQEEIQKLLKEKSDEELLELFTVIIRDNPFLYEASIELIINNLYGDNENFIKLLCDLVEKTSGDFAFSRIVNIIRETASGKPEETFAMAKRMIELRMGDGVCAGIMVSTLLGKGVFDDEIISYLESDDIFLQRISMIAILGLLNSNNTRNTKFFIEKLLVTAENIDSENTEILIQCLMKAFLIDKESVLPVLEKEVERRGYLAAIVYTRKALYWREFPISLLKKAVEIIESETPDNEIIDEALARIYEEDKNFVLERLRKRLIEGNGIKIAGYILVRSIQEKDYFPVIQMLEEEIQNENPKMIFFGENILGGFFPSKQEWLEWCKKWEEDERKRGIILRSLSKILTELISYQPSQIRDEAIDLVKELAKKEGLDYEKETKEISLGKDLHEGAKYKEAAIKALYIIKKLLSPPVKVNAEILKENLTNYPFLSKAIGAEWLIRNAGSNRPHLLAYIYSEKVNHEQINKLLEALRSEKDENKKWQIAFQYESLANSLRTQLYWEQVFKTLNEYGLSIPKSKLRDPDNIESILAETEVIARLARHFEVEIEPDIPEFKPNKLDAKIKFNEKEALIEVAVVKKKIELEVAHGIIALPGNKVKNVLLSKFNKQLKKGKVNTSFPVIFVLCLDTGINSYDVENAIYGELQFHFKMQTDTHQIIEKGPTRASNSFYDIEGTDIITAIAAYKRDYAKKDPLVGKLYRPPLIPRNSLSKEFRIRLRDALFGESENSDWRSLTKIEAISEDIAKKLYAEGIEDLRVLAMATDDELQVNGFDIPKMKELRQEARRIIWALKTGSIKFLKGMNQEIYNLLVKKGIYLIEQIAELDKTPEEIDSEIWKKIRKDAQRIMTN